MPAVKRALRRLSRRTVTLIALSVVAAALFSVLVSVHGALYGTHVGAVMGLGAILCGAPLIALAYPRTAMVAFSAAGFVLPLLASPGRDPLWPWPWSVPALIALTIFVFVLTVLHGWRLGLITWGVSIAGALAAPLFAGGSAVTFGAVVADLIVAASISGAALLIAVLLAGRIRISEELSKSRELTSLEQSRRELIEERTRIARELHDVVAHSMSLIQVQASTARYRIADLPPAALAELDDIARIARGSLTEMRRLLGVLRTDDQTPQLTPQQGIADIPVLVDSIRRAGVHVGLALTAPSSEPPPSVQITAYRIVQEALSNAVRHAPGAAIEVEVGALGAAVTVRVHNAGTKTDARIDAGAEVQASSSSVTAAEAASGSGHGLRGMRERVALLDGSLSTGPDPAGGWTVTAELPWIAAGEEPT